MSNTIGKHCPYTTYINKMASKVHSIVDFSAKEARIKLELAKCMQKTWGNQNPWLHKNRSYVLIHDFYPYILLLTTKVAYGNKYTWRPCMKGVVEYSAQSNVYDYTYMSIYDSMH